MSYSSTTAILLGFAGLAVWFLIVRVRTYARLSHIPGAFWAGWTDLWLIRAQLSGRISFILAEENTKHGTTAPFTHPYITRHLARHSRHCDIVVVWLRLASP